MQETNNRAFKGVWIPKDIWLAQDLGWTEKMVLVELDSLNGEQGCFASNKYLASFFGLSIGRISKVISALKEKGYITVDMQYKKGTKEIDRRIIKTTIGVWSETATPPSQEQPEAIVENVDTPMVENSQDNNTGFNNTFNNTNYIKTNHQPNNLMQQDNTPTHDPGWGQVVNFYHMNIHPTPAPIVYEKLGMMYDLYPIAELVLEALQIAVLNHAKNHIHYAEPILLRWRSQNIKTVEQARFEQRKDGQQHASNRGKSISTTTDAEERLRRETERLKKFL